MKEKKYSQEFKQEILNKVGKRGQQSLPDFAQAHGINRYTLKNWLHETKQAPTRHNEALPVGLEASKWDAAQRLMALKQTYNLDAQALGAWCRTHGLFEHQLQAWQDQFCSATESTQSKAALRELQTKYQDSQRDLRRKEKALAEAAALLVLQKKFQALLED
jgi:transposase-like protein